MDLSQTPVYSCDVRRPLWFRALVAIWGVWFAVAITDAAGVVACPMHTASAAASHAATAELNHVHGAMGVSGESKAPSVPGHNHAQCNCLGVGCCGSSPATPVAAIVNPAGELDRTHVTIRARVGAPAVVRAHDHPFAIGPPSLA